MLVGGGVEHHFGAVVSEELAHPLPIPDGGNFYRQVQPPAVFVQQFLLDVVGVVFIDVHNDQPAGAVLDNLAAEFGADGTAAAGDHDGFPA